MCDDEEEEDNEEEKDNDAEEDDEENDDDDEEEEDDDAEEDDEEGEEDDENEWRLSTFPSSPSSSFRSLSSVASSLSFASAGPWSGFGKIDFPLMRSRKSTDDKTTV